MTTSYEHDLNGKQVVIYSYPTMGGIEILCKLATCFFPGSSIARFQEFILLIMKQIAVIEAGNVPIRVYSNEFIDKHFSIEDVIILIKMSLSHNIKWFDNSLVRSYMSKAVDYIKTNIPVWLMPLVPFLLQIIAKIKEPTEIIENVDTQENN